MPLWIRIPVRNQNDEYGAFRLNCYSMNRDKLYLTAFCTDSTLSEFNDPYTSFYINGNKEEEGNYKNGSKEGLWQKWDTLHRKWIQLFTYRISL